MTTRQAESPEPRRVIVRDLREDTRRMTAWLRENEDAPRSKYAKAPRNRKTK